MIRKDYNELVPDLIEAIEDKDVDMAKEYLRIIAGHMFKDVSKLGNRKLQNQRIAERARRFKNVISSELGLRLKDI